jgi:hypothetical protein
MLGETIVMRSTNFEEVALMKSSGSYDFTGRSYENLNDDPLSNWKTDFENWSGGTMRS